MEHPAEDPRGGAHAQVPAGEVRHRQGEMIAGYLNLAAAERRKYDGSEVVRY